MSQMLNQNRASRFARLVLAGLHREYPSKLDHVLNDEAALQPPRRLHPAFFGCFDWHSAVHGHWVLARLVRLTPALPEAHEIRTALAQSLTPENIAGEVAYLSRPNTGTFERTYGWAWLLKLAEELGRGHQTRELSRVLEPLTAAFVRRYLDYLPRADYPIRTGVHASSAFGLAFAHDYAVATAHKGLHELVEAKALAFFGRDADYPAHLEPGGADFFSPALMEAELMRRVLPAPEFGHWFERFLPGAGRSQPANLFEPAAVSDRADLQIVHLDGLNLSRAWCLRNLSRARSLQGAASVAAALKAAADRHLAASLPHVCSSEYAGEHWLATFAVLAITAEAE
jgi:hypothetical protein